MNHLESREYSDIQYQQMGVLGVWKALLDIHNAILYGFTHCRLPQPGRPVDVAEAEAHIASIERQWEAESLRRDPTHQWTGAPPLSKIPLNAKLYLHSVLNGEGVNDWSVPGGMRRSITNDLFYNLERRALR